MTAFMKTYMALKNALKFSIRKEIIHLLLTQNFPKKITFVTTYLSDG